MGDLGQSWQNLVKTMSKVKLGEPYKPVNEYEAVAKLWNNAEINVGISNWLKSIESDITTLTETDSYSNKSKEKTVFHKECGNVKFYNKNYMDAIMCYNEGMACAPVNDLDYLLILTNRASALMKMGNYERALVDLETANENDYPIHKRYKLLNKLGKCFFYLGNKANSRLNYQKAIDSLIYESDIFEEIEPTKAVLERMLNAEVPIVNMIWRRYPRLSNEKKYLKGASADLNLSYTPGKGRHIIAGKNLKKDDVLFEEEPFAWVVFRADDMARFTCENCCKIVINQFTCNHCTGSHYCSVQCKNEAWNNFHRWECAGVTMNLWETFGIAHLALRVLLMGSRTNLKFEKCPNPTNVQSLLNFLVQEESLVSDYDKVMHLVTNFINIPLGDMKPYAIASITIVMYLRDYTPFFAENINRPPGITDGAFELFYACLLFKHVCQMICNSSIVNSETNDRHLATAIYPSTSMMNHSCTPNTVHRFIGKKLIMQAAHDLRSGAEVYNCYGLQSNVHDTDYRKYVLQTQYGFTCDCAACNTC